MGRTRIVVAGAGYIGQAIARAAKSLRTVEIP